MISQDTVFVNKKNITRKWHLVDAKDKILGRVAVEIAKLLRGKHKPEFTPHQEVGDYVVVINAEKARLTGRKEIQKMYYRHSGYPGSLKSETYRALNRRKPGYALEHAVRRMLPKNRLGSKLMNNVKIYVGSPDPLPHKAQKPEIYEVK